MRVIKKVNNNVAVALNDKNEEIFIVGKGVGFQKTPYDIVDENIIEKIYVVPKNIKMFDILNDIPPEDIYLAEEIILMGKKMLDKELNPNLLLTLSDHLNFSIQRNNEELNIRSPLEWEVRSIYPEEVEVARKALEIIKAKRGLTLPQSEVTLIALHFVNAQIGSGQMSETTKITTIIGEILSIIKYTYEMDFEENSLEFRRFATHIRYFVTRQMHKKTFSNENESIFQFVQEKHPEHVRCVEKIDKFLEANYSWTCSNDEKLYLVLHILRLTSKSNI